MFQLWTTSKIPRLSAASQRDVTFYAPLLESLDFMGIDPVTFTRAATQGRVGRDGLIHAIAANVPRFDYTGELPVGLVMLSGQTVQFSAQNGLDNANTLVWFENTAPKSTPTNANPFSSSGIWTGTLNVAVKHVLKMNRIASSAEIAAIQLALADVAQSFPLPPTAGDLPPSTFVQETPSGVRNGVNTVYTLSQNPNLDSLLLMCFGVTCERVASAPGQMQFTASGTGNKTVTMGMAPNPGGPPFFASYVTA